MFRPALLSSLKTYTKQTFLADLFAGLTVGVVAIPLAMAFAIACGLSPTQGLITAIVAGFLISLFSGSKYQIGGPTGAFVIIIMGVLEQYHASGLLVCTLMAGLFLIILGFCRMGALIRFIPFPVTTGFTSGIAVVIFSTQIKDIFGLTITEKIPGDFIEKWACYFNYFHTINWAALALAVIMVPSYLASNNNEYYYGAAHMFGTNTRLGADTAAIEETFGKSDTWVVLVPEGDTATQQKLSDALHAIPEVTGILSYVDNAGASIPPEFVPSDTLKLLVSGGYTRMVLTVDADTEGDGAFALVERVRATVQQYYPDNYYLAGQGVSTYDLMDTITADMVKVNLLAIGAVFLILLLMKRQLLLPIILVLSIETAIWINLAIPYFRGQYVFYIAYLIISSVQLGATVDYAILFSDRYQEFRETLGRKEAVAATVSAVTTSVSTTGSAMAVVGFLMGAISTNQLLGQLGNFLGVGGLVSLAIVLLALPGYLYLADPLIIKPKKQPKEA